MYSISACADVEAIKAQNRRYDVMYKRRLNELYFYRKNFKETLFYRINIIHKYERYLRSMAGIKQIPFTVMPLKMVQEAETNKAIHLVWSVLLYLISLFECCSFSKVLAIMYRYIKIFFLDKNNYTAIQTAMKNHILCTAYKYCSICTHLQFLSED